MIATIFNSNMNIGNGGSKKGLNEMDPPGTIGEVKRKKKGNMTPAPFAEGIKRTMSAKTPSVGISLTSNENSGMSYNQGRWTSLEHYKFLEALKRYGKEWQKVQQHVNTRTSTQARSHAQKFFVKLDKKSLTLEEFLKDLDLEDVKRNLLSAGADNTDYDEEREVNIIANKKLRGSVMNLALPGAPENNKNMDISGNEAFKRAKPEAEVTKRSNDTN
jgi:SHAQKYF class myb-like DNA-binding protein